LDKAGIKGLNFKEGVKYYPSLMLPELNPPKYTQTKVYGRGFKCINISSIDISKSFL